jgi:diphosphomevalonate decarboxylase
MVDAIGAPVEEPSGGEHTATARAHSNIALVKYWGKRDAVLNIPAVGSISITLDALATDTTVVFDPENTADELWLDGRQVDARRASGVLDVVRERADIRAGAIVTSTNNFPTGAGLASSASGFAALALAASAAAGLALDERELSILARRGSGSAARSVFGGFVELYAGGNADGTDSFAEPLLERSAWPLCVVVAITATEQKSVSSRAGMAGSAASSPFYASWVDTAAQDLTAMRAAIAARDLGATGELAEYSCLKLHALMLTTRPALIYWNPATVAAIHTVRELRASGIPVYFTIDAGPQVKALCDPSDADVVARALAAVPGVLETRTSALGPGARLVAAA